MALSPYIVAIVLGWITAQGLKYAIVALRDRNFDRVRQLYLSGNMPSAHSATVSALATVVGLRAGVDSPLFAIAALFAGITMYDAVMVRRSVGEQGIAVQTLIKLAKNQRITAPRAAKGHTPLEVIAGAALGAAIGVIVFFATI